jgi:hypothetical protein
MTLSDLDRRLAEGVLQVGCPVCRLLREDETRYWDFFLYEGFQDSAAAVDLRRSLGYCRRHVEQLARQRDAFASALLAAASLRGALATLLRERSSFRRRELQRPGFGCPVCARLADWQELCVRRLAELVASDTAFADNYRASDGLCFDHLGPALHAGAAAMALKEHAVERLERLEGEVRALAASFEYRSRPPTAELATAWRRAFAALRGDPGRVPL